jgi:large subunit ribosomal protein L10e
MGNTTGTYSAAVQLQALEQGNIRHNALESARITANKLLEKKIPKNYHFRIRTYPHHILRENPLAAGAGADRMSTGMKMSFGKPIGIAARVGKNQIVMDVRVQKEHILIAKEALMRAAKKLPGSFKIVQSS